MTICVDQDRLHTDLRADGRVRSRLRSTETIHLDRYSRPELIDIVKYRVEHGLDSELVADGAVAEIADLATGDAREAISLLRHGARHVRQGHAEELTADVVHEVADEAREGIRERRIRYLGTHKRALYEIVREGGPDGIGASELHERCAERVQEDKSQRTVRRYLEQLEEYDLLEASGETRARRYRVQPAVQYLDEGDCSAQGPRRKASTARRCRGVTQSSKTVKPLQRVPIPEDIAKEDNQRRPQVSLGKRNELGELSASARKLWWRMGR